MHEAWKQWQKDNGLASANGEPLINVDGGDEQQPLDGEDDPLHAWQDPQVRVSPLPFCGRAVDWLVWTMCSWLATGNWCVVAPLRLVLRTDGFVVGHGSALHVISSQWFIYLVYLFGLFIYFLV